MGRSLICRKKPSTVPAAKALLDGFLEHGAISQAQHDKRVQELKDRMGTLE